MTESQVAILLQNQDELMNMMSIETVLSILTEKKVLPTRVLDSFLANAHPLKMVIDYLMCHTPRGFKWLVRALRKTSQHGIANLLEMNSGKDMKVYLVGTRHTYHIA